MHPVEAISAPFLRRSFETLPEIVTRFAPIDLLRIDPLAQFFQRRYHDLLIRFWIGYLELGLSLRRTRGGGFRLRGREFLF